MASEDFYSFAANQQYQKLEAIEAQEKANLAAARAANDYESAASSVQELANISAAKQNLVSLHQEYVRSQQPPEQPELTPEEQAAKPWQRMNWVDGLKVAQSSKYGSGIDANDPNVQAGFREVMRRRQRGE